MKHFNFITYFLDTELAATTVVTGGFLITPLTIDVGMPLEFSPKGSSALLLQWPSAGSAPHPLFFCNYLCFCNHFEEELKTVLTQVKLIINNATNHLLFGRQFYFILTQHQLCLGI